MMKVTVKTDKAPQAIGPYSQGTQAANFIFTSGQLPINPQTGELVGEIKSATKQSLENVKAILEAAGAKMSEIMKVTIFLKDMNDFTAMNEVYGQFFPEEPPARSAVQVARLPKDAIIEIEAIAVTSDHLSD